MSMAPLLPLPLVERRVTRAGDVIHAQGDSFRGLSVICGGTFKSTRTFESGQQQVVGFHLAGDALGLDAVAGDRHEVTVTALEHGQFFVLGKSAMRNAMACDAALHRQVNRLMSYELVRAQRRMLLLGSSTAGERLAAMLLDWSARLHERGFSAHEFILRMTRAEIGSYLGLKFETVSRVLTHFQQDGSLQVDSRRIRFADRAGFARRFEALLQA